MDVELRYANEGGISQTNWLGTQYSFTHRERNHKMNFFNKMRK